MWKPGDMLEYPVYDLQVDDEFPALIIAVRDTGWGTLGQKWDGVLLCRGRIVSVREAWRKRWRIIKTV